MVCPGQWGVAHYPRGLSGLDWGAVGEEFVHPQVDRPVAGDRRATSRTLRGTTTRDLQTLLSTAVQRVQQISEATAVAAWTLRETGEPYVAAAMFSGDPPVTPDAADFRSLAELSGVDAAGRFVGSDRDRSAPSLPRSRFRFRAKSAKLSPCCCSAQKHRGRAFSASSSEKRIGCRLPLQPLSRWHGSSEPIATSIS